VYAQFSRDGFEHGLIELVHRDGVTALDPVLENIVG
jgi:hypothetical protein